MRLSVALGRGGYLLRVALIRTVSQRPETSRLTAAPSRLKADVGRKTPDCRASAGNGKLGVVSFHCAAPLDAQYRRMVRPLLLSMLGAFAIASCSEGATETSKTAQFERYRWEDVRSTDGTVVENAKRACAQYKVVPMPGGTDPFTGCMKRQADAAFGTPNFEKICDAIPGSRISRSEQKCMTFDL